MPFAFEPMPRPYMERENPVANALAAYGGVQELQTHGMKNQMLQEGLQERKDVRNVMAGEGPLESKWEKVFAISPESGERMARAIHYMQPDEKARYAKVGLWIEKTVPMLQKPEQVALWRNDLARIAPEIAAYVPTAQELAQPGEMEKFQQTMLQWTKVGQEQLRQQGIRGTIGYKESLVGERERFKQGEANWRTQRTAESREKSAGMRARSGYAPQLVENEEGTAWAIPPSTDNPEGMIVPIPEKFRKAKAEGRFELNKAAMGLAINEVKTSPFYQMDPGSEKSQKLLMDAYEKQQRILAGGKGKSTQAGYRAFNKRTGQWEEVTKEQYEQIKQLQGK